jgi:hypothetical protein
VAQPRYADGAAGDTSEDGGDRQGQQHRQDTATGGLRPWEMTRRGTFSGASGSGARGRGRLPASPVRVARTLRLVVDEWGWPVVPGAFVEAGMCSCGDPNCAEAGRHALSDASWLAATSDADRVRDRWRAHPEAAIVLPVGWCFDLLEVPERGGREAIGRLEAHGFALPPVIATATGRLLFLVAALDRNASEAAEAGSSTPAPRAAASPRPAASVGRAGDDEAARDAVAARDSITARAAVTELEPWPASSTWLASAAGCRPETSIWVGGGALDAPDVVVRRSGLLVAPLLGPEPPGVTRWLVPPSATRRPLSRMEDVLGPIVQACREMAVRPSFGHGPARRSEEALRRPESGSRRPETMPNPGGGAVPVRGPESSPRRATGAGRPSEVISGREAEIPPVRGPERGASTPPPGTDPAVKWSASQTDAAHPTVALAAAAAGDAQGRRVSGNRDGAPVGGADRVDPDGTARPGPTPERGLVWPIGLNDSARRSDAGARRPEPAGPDREPARTANQPAGRAPGQGRSPGRPRSAERLPKPVGGLLPAGRPETQLRSVGPTWADAGGISESSVRPTGPGRDASRGH